MSSSPGFNAGYFAFLVGIHVAEAIFAVKLARDKNLNFLSCTFWFFQTLLLGVGSFEVTIFFRSKPDCLSPIQVLCEYEAPPNPKKQDYFKSPGAGWWIFMFGFWWILGGSAYSPDNSIFDVTKGKIFQILYQNI